MKHIFLLIVLFTISLESYGGVTKNPSTVIVEAYRVQTSGTRFSVSLDRVLTANNAGCGTSPKSFYVVRPANDDEARLTAYDQMFATIVAAKFNNTPISVWISDDACSSNIPIGELIRVE